MTPEPMLFVELQIARIAGISRISAPHLDTGFRIASEECNFVLGRAAWSIGPIWAIERCPSLSAFVFGRDRNSTGKQLIGSEQRTALDHVRIHEEVFEPIGVEDLFDSRAQHHGFFGCASVQVNGVPPFAPRTIRALRQPYAARTPPKEA